jgi:hypothetical protein
MTPKPAPPAAGAPSTTDNEAAPILAPTPSSPVSESRRPTRTQIETPESVRLVRRRVIGQRQRGDDVDTTETVLTEESPEVEDIVDEQPTEDQARVSAEEELLMQQPILVPQGEFDRVDCFLTLLLHFIGSLILILASLKLVFTLMEYQ